MTFHQAKDSTTGNFMYLFSIRYKNSAVLQFSGTYLHISDYAVTKEVWIFNEKQIYGKVSSI